MTIPYPLVPAQVHSALLLFRAYSINEQLNSVDDFLYLAGFGRAIALEILFDLEMLLLGFEGEFFSRMP